MGGGEGSGYCFSLLYADELDEPELEVVVKPNRPSPIRLLWRGGSGVGEVGGRVVVGLFEDAAVFCFFLAGVFGIIEKSTPEISCFWEPDRL